MKKVFLKQLATILLLATQIETQARSLSADAAKTEKPGPSSRRSALVISEVMYHPVTTEGGANLEFIEIYNSHPWWEELGNFRIDGDVRFTFPSETRIDKSGYVVIAADPEAVKKAYGLEQVFGPFDGRLANSGGRLSLRNDLDAILFEVDYETRAPWPSSADGAGHSLALRRPSYGERDVRAWTQSDLIGGSPGRADTPGDEPLRPLAINEIKTNREGDTPTFVELYNHSASEIDLSGVTLTDSIDEQKYTFAKGSKLAGGGTLAVGASALGFEFAADRGVVWMFNAEGNRVLDALHYRPQPDGYSLGRSTDGSAQWNHFAEPTPGQANAAPFQHTVVINEIMYNPISLDDNDEYVELHNHGDRAVDLSNWEFNDGIIFTFPDPTMLPAGGYIVVAKNREQLLSKHKGLAPKLVVGNYTGTLSNRGERLLLTEPKEALHNGQPIATESLRVPVDEVTYHDSAAWGEWSDAGGSSLELRDPRSENRHPYNWASSDESAKSEWGIVTGEGPVDRTRGQTFPSNYLQIFLLDKGECLVDDVQVYDARTNAKRVDNPGFENSGKLEIAGTHKTSVIVEDQGTDGTRALHVKAVNRGDTECNAIWVPLTGRNAANMRIEGKARWLRGHPELLIRTRSGGFEAFGALPVPDNLGTPGKPNTALVMNTGPAISNVIHSPIFPPKGETATVTARVADPDGLAKVALHYRLDPSKSTTEVKMFDDGTSGDAVSGDGLFSAQIPAQSSTKLICFWVEATDALDQAQTTTYPTNAPARECLVRMGINPDEANDLGQYHFLLNHSNTTIWTRSHKRSNAPVPVTMVYNGERVIYNAGMYYGAGSFHSQVYSGPSGALSDYNATYPSDDRFLGAKKILLSMPGAPSERTPEPTAQIEQSAYWLMYKSGVPYMHRRFVNLYINGRKRAKVYEDTQRPNRDIVQQWYPNGEGELFKIQMWKEMSNPNRSRTYQYQSHPAVLSGNQDVNEIQPWYYRLSWAPRAYDGSANQMDNLFTLVERINDTRNPDYIQRLEEVANMEQWMRVFAVQNIVCNWDSYGASNGQNMSTFRPANGRFEMIPWDIDLGFGKGSFGTSNKLFAMNNPFFWGLNGDPIIKRIYANNHFKRYYLRTVLEMIDGPMKDNTFRTHVDKKYKALRANGQTVTSPGSLTSFIKGRASYLKRTVDRMDDDFTLKGETKVDTDEQTIALSGTAPLRMKHLMVNGVPQQPNWGDLTTWNLSLPVEATQKSYSITAVDGFGQAIDGATQTVEVHYTGDKPLPHESVQINEWMAANDSTIQDKADGKFDDWIELHNHSPHMIDLAGWGLTDDKQSPRQWLFPEGATLPAGGFLILWADDQPQQTGDEFHLPFKLDADGEAILLFDPEGRLVDEVTFGKQKTNEAMGRPSDNGAPKRLARATPGSPNVSGGAAMPNQPIKLKIDPGQPLTITFQGEDGVKYLLEQSTDLRTWNEAHSATGQSAPIRHVIPHGQAQPESFFRVRITE
jgi:hypothetical protein